MTIPSSVTSIDGWSALPTNLSSITVAEDNPVYDSRNNCNAVIETATNKLVAGYETTVIPADVSIIGMTALSGRSNLEAVDIPVNVKQIENNAFEWSYNLNSVVCHWKKPVPFGENAFDHIGDACILTVPYGTKDIYISAGWTEEIFKGGIVETSIIAFADETVKSLCLANWDTNNDGELSKEEAAAITDIGTIFKENKDIQSFDELKFFTGLTTIGEEAFHGCSNLALVEFPEGLTTIGEHAFQDAGLTSVSFPNSLEWAGIGAFRYCPLKSINFNRCNATFDYSCFQNCAIEELYIPNTVKFLGPNVFGYIYVMKNVEMEAYEDGQTPTWEASLFPYNQSLESITVCNTKVMGDWFLGGDNNLKSLTIQKVEDDFDPQYRNYAKIFADVSYTNYVKINIPDGYAEPFLHAGYFNLSDPSGLPLVREEFEAEAERVIAMANQLPGGDQDALTAAIGDARSIVNAAEDYLTVYAQIDAVKNAAKAYVNTIHLASGNDVTAAFLLNPDFARLQFGWNILGGNWLRGWNDGRQENGDVVIDHFVGASAGEPLIDGKISQTIKQLPAGIYRLEADAIASSNTEEAVTGATFYAGRNSIPMSTENGKPQHFSIRFENPSRQDVAVGINLAATNAQWVAADNFRLIYEGEVAPAPAGSELVSSETETYYIYNVGTGMYLNGGNGWGAQTVLSETGLPVRVTQDEEGYWNFYFREGSSFQQLMYNRDDGCVFTNFFGAREGDDIRWLVSAKDGGYTIQSAGDAGTDFLLGNDPTRKDLNLSNGTALDTHIDVIRTDNAANNTLWQFIKAADYDQAMAKRYLLNAILCMDASDAPNEELLNNANSVYNDAEATLDEVIETTTLLNSQMGMPQEEHPIDMTALIVNPAFEKNTTEGWTGVSLGEVGSRFKSFSGTTFNMYQRITGIPNGRYRLKYKGFHSPGGEEAACADYVAGNNNASAVVYANGVQKTLKHIYEDASSTPILGYGEIQYNGKYVPIYGAPRSYFDAGLYADYLEVEVTDNTLTIGVKSTQDNMDEHKVCFSDFELEILENTAQLSNQLAMMDAKSVPGGSTKLPVLLTNSDEIVSSTFSITLPQGVKPATNADGSIQIKTSKRVPTGMTITGNVTTDGVCRFAIMPGSNSIQSGEGEIFSITLLPDATMEMGEYNITLSETKLVTSDLLRVQPTRKNSKLTLTEPESGDVNGDGTTDILDATYIVYHILRRTLPVYYEGVGDVNGDGDTDILDATIIVYREIGRSVGGNAPIRNDFEQDPE
ncbi:MAG: leucine-rich repeat protein [Bacteroidaceae bacterium]|nr:leucine-rich repeat protein [Bacteroidaceae bacterium]